MKEGWHPKGKDGKKESWRNDFKGINQVVSVFHPPAPIRPLADVKLPHSRQDGWGRGRTTLTIVRSMLRCLFLRSRTQHLLDHRQNAWVTVVQQYQHLLERHLLHLLENLVLALRWHRRRFPSDLNPISQMKCLHLRLHLYRTVQTELGSTQKAFLRRLFDSPTLLPNLDLFRTFLPAYLLEMLHPVHHRRLLHHTQKQTNRFR